MKSVLAVLVFSFFLGTGPVLWAQSLERNSDSWQVAKATAKSSGKTHASDKAAFDTQEDLGSGFWVRAYGGWDFSLMNDIIRTIKSINSQAIAAGYTGSLSVSNNGMDLGGEIGLDLDQDNGLSLSAGNVLPGGQSFTAVKGTNKIGESATPNLLDISCNYYRYLSNDKGGKTSVSLGLGYYHAGLAYSANSNIGSGSTASANLGGDILGGTLGLEREWDLGGSFSLDLSLKGRLAYFSQVTTSSVTYTGGTFVGTGTGLFNLASVSSTGLVLAQDSLFTNPAIQRIGVDYSGLTGNIGVSYSF